MGRKDGISVLEEARRTNREISLYLLTAFSGGLSEQQLQRLEGLGVEVFSKLDMPNLLESALHLQPLAREQEPPRAIVDIQELLANDLIGYLRQRPNELRQIRPERFEELIAEILAGYGWKVQLTPRSRDGGHDIFAIVKDAAGIQSAWMIECKRYSSSNKVGVELVRQLFGAKTLLHPDTNVLLATTSSFTSGARLYEASRYDLELRDYEAIIDWINEYQPHPSGKLYIKENRIWTPQGPESAT